MKVVEAIADCFRNREGVILHDYTCDADHNRMVITASGEVQAIRLSLFEAIGTAIERIDLNKHKGVHPRMGAADDGH